jgi:hypothetical protein
MEHLGITEYVTNRLEFVNGAATGRLLPPVMAAATKALGAQVNDLAGVDLPGRAGEAVTRSGVARITNERNR